METKNYMSEHHVVLTQQRDAVYETEKVVGKIGNIVSLLKEQLEANSDINLETLEQTQYTLESIVELLDAVLIRSEKIKANISEFHRIDEQIDSDYKDELQKMKFDLENHVGIVERDEHKNLHCGTCMVPYKYCQDMVGKKVRLSLITLNVCDSTRNTYPIFAKHVDVIEE